MSPALEEEAGFAISPTNKGVFSKAEPDFFSVRASAADSAFTKLREALLLLVFKKLAQCFEMTTTEGKVLHCLSMQIVFSPSGVSLDQAGSALRHAGERLNGQRHQGPARQWPAPCPSQA